jgi:hypothetical protein
MRDRATQFALIAAVVLLAFYLFHAKAAEPPVRAQNTDAAPAILRAQEIVLVDRNGQTVAQLYVGEDGGGNLRLRSGDGMVRVKLGATAEGAGLILFDRETEPAVWLASKQSGASITLAEKGGDKRVIRP